MRAVKVLAAVTALTSVGGAGSAALAAAKPAGGPIQVFVSSIGNVKAKILFTGAIGDYGTALTVNKSGKVDPNGDYQKVTLKKGGFWVNATALDKKLSQVTPVVNSATCSVVVSGSAQTTVYRGSGAYAGISGRVKITVIFAGIAPRLPSGACNAGPNVHVRGQYQSITGTGRVAFS
jgi:hypothetical protein